MAEYALRFPQPSTFDTFGGPGSNEATIKVLEEAAEFVEAVKDYENLPGCPECPDNVPLWRSQAKMRVLDEAMDVYQAVSNFLGSPEEEYTAGFDGYKSRSNMNKQTAMGVLIAAAGLFGDCGKDHHRYDEENADNVLWNLAFVLWGEFSDEEIAEAYERCLNRNRIRGRL